MNEQLIKFIELCLMDGVISDKEREVIFRKSKELGVPGILFYPYGFYLLYLWFKKNKKTQN